MRFEKGPGLFILGATLGVDGGALAILQRRHERVTQTNTPALGPWTSRRTLEEAERDAYRSCFELRHVETFGADRPRSEFANRVRSLVEAPPLDGETSVMLDITDLGDALSSHFYERIGRENYVTHLTLTKEATSQPGTIRLLDVREAIIALREAKRFEAAGKIAHHNEVARVLEHARSGDELPRLALAIGLACHYAKGNVARGPCASRQIPKPGSKEFAELESWTMLQRELRRIREDQEEGRWWPR